MGARLRDAALNDSTPPPLTAIWSGWHETGKLSRDWALLSGIVVLIYAARCKQRSAQPLVAIRTEFDCVRRDRVGCLFQPNSVLCLCEPGRFIGDGNVALYRLVSPPADTARVHVEFDRRGPLWRYVAGRRSSLTTTWRESSFRTGAATIRSTIRRHPGNLRPLFTLVYRHSTRFRFQVRTRAGLWHRLDRHRRAFWLVVTRTPLGSECTMADRRNLCLGIYRRTGRTRCVPLQRGPWRPRNRLPDGDPFGSHWSALATQSTTCRSRCRLGNRGPTRRGSNEPASGYRSLTI